MRALINSSMFRASAALIGVSLAACSESSLSQYSNSEMREKRAECRTAKEPAPAFIYACDNYARECKKRNKAAGTIVC